MRNMTGIAAGLAACVAIVATSFAAEPTPAQSEQETAGAQTFRVTKLMGLAVRDEGSEKLGSISDLVVDPETGRVYYVALSIGGVLGIGERLFAVPLGQLELKQDASDNVLHFVLNVPISKERLKEAKGFDKDHWPDVADPHWSERTGKITFGRRK